MTQKTVVQAINRSTNASCRIFLRLSSTSRFLLTDSWAHCSPFSPPFSIFHFCTVLFIVSPCAPFSLFTTSPPPPSFCPSVQIHHKHKMNEVGLNVKFHNKHPLRVCRSCVNCHVRRKKNNRKSTKTQITFTRDFLSLLKITSPKLIEFLCVFVSGFVFVRYSCMCVCVRVEGTSQYLLRVQLKCETYYVSVLKSMFLFKSTNIILQFAFSTTGNSRKIHYC